MTTINVNLKPCDCSWSGEVRPHDVGCRSAPVLLPCRVPGSFTCEVVLGECTAGCAAPGAQRALSERGEPHHQWCPARPIRVSCSISGKTWEESEPVDPEGHGQDGRLVGFTFASPIHIACRERWALVKALVLGRHGIIGPDASSRVHDLERQRDAVYAALADMAQHEEAAMLAQKRIDEAFPIHDFLDINAPDHRATRPSTARLDAFLKYLVQQIGNTTNP